MRAEGEKSQASLLSGGGGGGGAGEGGGGGGLMMNSIRSTAMSRVCPPHGPPRASGPEKAWLVSQELVSHYCCGPNAQSLSQQPQRTEVHTPVADAHGADIHTCCAHTGCTVCLLAHTTWGTRAHGKTHGRVDNVVENTV